MSFLFSLAFAADFTPFVVKGPRNTHSGHMVVPFKIPYITIGYDMKTFFDFLSALPRSGKVFFQIILDASLVNLNVSFAIIVLTTPPNITLLQLAALCAIPTVLALTSLALLGIYRIKIQFLTGRALPFILLSTAASTTGLYLVLKILDFPSPTISCIIYFLLAFLEIGGWRFVARFLFRRSNGIKRRPIIVYGAGEAGRQILSLLFYNGEYVPVALLDDNRDLQGLYVGGVKVFPAHRIAELISSTNCRDILLAMPRISRERKSEIVALLRRHKLNVVTMPPLSDVIAGRAKLDTFQPIRPEDVLGRDPIEPDERLLKRNIFSKVVLITGAGGSIGSELCRQALRASPHTLILFDLSEFNLYNISEEISAVIERTTSSTRLVSILGSVTDKNRVYEVVRDFGVDTIFHAAAFKHVPIVEDNIIEGVANNCLGTFVLADVAVSLGVERFILISTDKAVRPTNFMGASKRLAELICQSFAKRGTSTVFSMVRFGNVLASSGSVIPKFQAQIADGGPVTVTHREIIRYFMTIPEAAQLVIQAGAMARGGDVFVLDMGAPVRILDLAINVITFHGFDYEIFDTRNEIKASPGVMPILITGLRKGEKLYEELLVGTSSSPTEHARIFTASEKSVEFDELVVLLEEISKCCGERNLAKLKKIIMESPVDFAFGDGKAHSS